MKINPVRLIVSLVLTALLFSGPSLSAAPPAIIAYYSDESDLPTAALRARYASFNQLATDLFLVNARGVVTGTIPSGDLHFARSKKMVTYATVSNFGSSDFSPSIGHAVITSASKTQLFIKGMLAKLAAGKFTGINVDFEAIPPRDRAAYTTFITTVAKQMHAAGYLVMISVPAELTDDPSDSWSGAFAFKTLGGLVDVLQLMTYDENGPWGDPGPVAGLDWVTHSADYARSVVPAGKISLGLPAYGYDWDLNDSTKSTTVYWNQLAALLAKTKATPQWDAASSSPYFTYTLHGQRHVVWYENAESIGLKSHLVTTDGLAGVSVWALGLEDAAFWQAVHSGGF